MNDSIIIFSQKNEVLKNGSVIFTSSQINILSRMVRHFRKMGSRYELTEQEQIDKMLEMAKFSKDLKIRNDFETLFNSFTKDIQKYYNHKLKNIAEKEEII